MVLAPKELPPPVRRDEFETHGLGSGTEFDFLTLLVAQLVGSKPAVVEFPARGDQVKDDPGQSCEQPK